MSPSPNLIEDRGSSANKALNAFYDAFYDDKGFLHNLTLKGGTIA